MKNERPDFASYNAIKFELVSWHWLERLYNVFCFFFYLNSEIMMKITTKMNTILVIQLEN